MLPTRSQRGDTAITDDSAYDRKTWLTCNQLSKVQDPGKTVRFQSTSTFEWEGVPMYTRTHNEYTCTGQTSTIDANQSEADFHVLAAYSLYAPTDDKLMRILDYIGRWNNQGACATKQQLLTMTKLISRNGTNSSENRLNDSQQRPRIDVRLMSKQHDQPRKYGRRCCWLPNSTKILVSHKT